MSHATRGRHAPPPPALDLGGAPSHEHVACPHCGRALDFAHTDALGRTRERCWTCGTDRLLPRRAAPPLPVGRPGMQGHRGPAWERRGRRP